MLTFRIVILILIYFVNRYKLISYFLRSYFPTLQHWHLTWFWRFLDTSETKERPTEILWKIDWKLHWTLSKRTEHTRDITSFAKGPRYPQAVILFEKGESTKPEVTKHRGGTVRAIFHRIVVFIPRDIIPFLSPDLPYPLHRFPRLYFHPDRRRSWKIVDRSIQNRSPESKSTPNPAPNASQRDISLEKRGYLPRRILSRLSSHLPAFSGWIFPARLVESPRWNFIFCKRWHLRFLSATQLFSGRRSTDATLLIRRVSLDRATVEIKIRWSLR